MLQASTRQLLRFPFSFFLMPVFFFALSFATIQSWMNTGLLFVILHGLVYPSSNGYNSFMDKDETSIGGVENPMQPTKELLMVCNVMDALAMLLAIFINWPVFCLLLMYIVCSRLYSYRGVRLKQYPIIGFLVVVLNQGALVFVAVSAAAAKANWTNFTSSFGMQTTIASLFLIGGFYPLTQIYQHQSDAKDGVKTISMLLGKRGTFVFCAICYAIAFAFIYTHFVSIGATENFLLLQLFFVPVVIVFLRWALAVWKDETAASFSNTMRMNWLAAVCTNAAFITLLIKQQLG